MKLFKSTLATHQTVIKLSNVDKVILKPSSNQIQITFYGSPCETLKYNSLEDAEAEYPNILQACIGYTPA